MGNRRIHKRARSLRGGIREMPFPKSMAGYPYMAVLVPEHWTHRGFRHDEIIDVVRGWGPCRVFTDKRIVEQRTRIYFPDEGPLLMLRVAYGDLIWKMFRDTNIEKD